MRFAEISRYCIVIIAYMDIQILNSIFVHCRLSFFTVVLTRSFLRHCLLIAGNIVTHLNWPTGSYTLVWVYPIFTIFQILHNDVSNTIKVYFYGFGDISIFYNVFSTRGVKSCKILIPPLAIINH